jgi:hypothetical protein
LLTEIRYNSTSLRRQWGTGPVPLCFGAPPTGSELGHDPQLFDHRAHRPRQVDAGGSLHSALRRLADREMEAQVLDTMDLERERGITIKAQTAALLYTARTDASITST